MTVRPVLKRPIEYRHSCLLRQGWLGRKGRAHRKIITPGSYLICRSAFLRVGRATVHAHLMQLLRIQKLTHFEQSTWAVLQLFRQQDAGYCLQDRTARYYRDARGKDGTCKQGRSSNTGDTLRRHEPLTSRSTRIQKGCDPKRASAVKEVAGRANRSTYGKGSTYIPKWPGDVPGDQTHESLGDKAVTVELRRKHKLLSGAHTSSLGTQQGGRVRLVRSTKSLATSDLLEADVTTTPLAPGLDPDNGPNNDRSLYEELFPNEAREPREKSGHDNTRRRKDREDYCRFPLPRRNSMPVRGELPNEVDQPQEPKNQSSAGQIHQVQEDIVLNSVRAVEIRELNVLMLRASSANLSLDDLRCIVPDSRRPAHARDTKPLGVSNASHGLLTAFPVRDKFTLDRSNRYEYYLVFSSADAAKEYRNHVTHLHTLMVGHSPTSLTPMIPRVPEMLEKKSLREALLKYALKPPSTRLHLEEVADSVIDQQYFKSLIVRGGYSQIARTLKEPKTQVMLWFPKGRQPGLRDILTAVALDGGRRGLEWELATDPRADEAGDDPPLYVKRVATRKPLVNKGQWDAAGLSQQPPSSMRLHFDLFADIRSMEVERVSGSQNAEESQRYSRHQVWGSAHGQRFPDVWEVLSPEELEEPEVRVKREQKGQRWILQFKWEAEAKRFARAWHMRPFSWPAMRGDKPTRQTDERTEVRCEYLW